MAETSSKVVLVTGASGGIGAELARLAARDGHSLLLVARNEQSLQAIGETCRQLGAPRAEFLAADLSRPDGPARVWEWTQSLGVEVDWLINNAGFGARGSFHEIELETTLQMLQLNITSLTELTRRYLPGMVQRRQGRVMNVASTAAYVPGPWLATYYASKAYVLSFSEALNVELAGSGVTVTAVCPGPTSTGFQKRAGMPDSFFKWAMSCEKCARIAYRGFLKGKPVCITGGVNNLLIAMSKFAPRRFQTKVTGKINRG
jgi:short-subunit dehydrogenase